MGGQVAGGQVMGSGGVLFLMPRTYHKEEVARWRS